MEFILKILLATSIAILPLNPTPPATTSLADYCATDFLHQNKLENDANYFQKHKHLEQLAYTYFHENNSESITPPDYILPVVVHIIHDNGAENIDDVTVEQGIADLNDAFGNLNYYDQGTGVDTRIQFCLAKRDPQGNLTTGINRVESALTEMNLENDDVDVKNLSRWNPTKYINIWLVKQICSGGGSGCGVAGYAYYPAAHGSEVDGIVLEANFFGSNSSNSAVQVHEMGHYLGLYHTFEGGCTNDFCLLNGDRVCDTPPDYSVVNVPCAVEPNSCFTDVNLADPDNPFTEDQPDMIINYMDYSDFTCYSAFTQGQADRMHFFIENGRESLLNTNACIDPCPLALVANFTASSSNIEVGTTVDFTNNSTGANIYEWSIDGNPFSTDENTSFIFSEEGTYIVNLNTLIDTLSFVCNEDFSVEINVSCSVAASFETSDVYPDPGDIVTFTNTSANASNYQWSVNGFPTVTTTDFSNPALLAGNYTVCLEADNGLCEDIQCITIIVEADLDSCNSSIVKRIGTSTESEWGLEILPLADESYFLTGRADDDALLMYYDVDDNLIWQRSFNFTSSDANHFRHIIQDTDGNLVLIGRGQSNSPTSFLMKYDYINDAVLWSKVMPNPNSTQLERLLEAPNGNYIIGGAIDPGPTSALDWHLMEIDRNTGNSVWQTTYASVGNTDFIHDMKLYNNKLYICGTSRHGGGLDDIRATFARFDLSGNIEWSNLYFNDTNSNARTYMNRFSIENDTVYGIHRGSTVNTDIEDHKAQFTKFDLEGNMLFAKQYETPIGNAFFGIRLIKLGDGFLFSGYYNVNSNGAINSFVLRTNDDGNVLWAKTFGEDTGAHYILDIVLNQGLIYMTGRSDQADGSGLSDAFFVKIPINEPDFGANCDFINDLEVIETDVPLYDEPFVGTQVEVDYTLNNVTTTGIPTNLVEEISCEPSCEELCGNGIDDDGDGLIDCCDPDLFDNPCCEDHPYLDLGEDQMICDNSVITLDAGDGFESYIWNDGTTEQTLTTYGPGEYFVTVEDAFCGTISDTIQLTELPETIAQADPQFMSICPGESVTITINPEFDSYEWLPNTYLDCDDCQTVVSTPDEPVQYIVVAHFDNGCYSVDTINIVIDGIQTGETITVCPEETVLIFDNPQNEPGMYSETYQTQSGCDSTHTITLQNFPPPPITPTITQSPTCNNPCGAEITISGPTDGLLFSLNGGEFTTNLVYSDLCADFYLIQVLDEMNCTFIFPVEILALPQVTAIIDPANASIAIGESVDLNIILSPNVAIQSITWTPPTNLSCTNCANPTATPLQNTTYEAAILDENGCAYVTSITIDVDNSCSLSADDVPSAFSPNNDELNDFFEYTAPEGTNAVLTNMYVYNRWGAVVFQSKVANDKWDGMVNGKPAPTDVYVYVMEVFCNDETEILRGDVTLLR